MREIKFEPKFSIYQEVYFIDCFDCDTNCSCFSDGSSIGHKEIKKVRKGKIDSITQLSNTQYVYRLYIKEITKQEDLLGNIIDMTYMSKSWSENELFFTREEAEAKLKEKENERNKNELGG